MRDSYEAGQPGAGWVFPKKVRGRDQGILMGQGRFGDGTPKPQGLLQAQVLLREAVLFGGLMSGGAEHQNHQEASKHLQRQIPQPQLRISESEFLGVRVDMCRHKQLLKPV